MIRTPVCSFVRTSSRPYVPTVGDIGILVAEMPEPQRPRLPFTPTQSPQDKFEKIPVLHSRALGASANNKITVCRPWWTAHPCILCYVGQMPILYRINRSYFTASQIPQDKLDASLDNSINKRANSAAIMKVA